MSESDELYAKALKYRDNKVLECSPEESRVEAEKLFLELSLQGDVKAMHNYAVLQQKKGNYKLAAEWFDKTGLDASKRNIMAMKECGQIKEDIYLVVASDRSDAGNQGSPIMDCVYGTGVDLSHTRSYNGNATTCDISRCALPGAKHIIADALTFDFAKKHNLKHVLIERLPTINPNEPMMGFGEGPINLDERGESDHKGFESEAKVNFFGSVVQNLSKAMESGAILEIEWDPYTTLWHLNREESKEIHIINPFHGFILNNAAVLGAQLVNPDTKVDHLSPELQAVAHEYGEKFRDEIVFWHSQGGRESPNEIYNRMHAEVELYRRLMEADKRARLAFVEANIRTDPTEKVIRAIRSATFDSYPAKVSGKRCKLPDGRNGVVYCARSLIADGLFGTAINSLCVQNNLPYAKRFLESIGFKDVVIERRTNTHNGRKNVWMVKAVKA